MGNIVMTDLLVEKNVNFSSVNQDQKAHRRYFDPGFWESFRDKLLQAKQEGACLVEIHNGPVYWAKSQVVVSKFVWNDDRSCMEISKKSRRISKEQMKKRRGVFLGEDEASEEVVGTKNFKKTEAVNA